MKSGDFIITLYLLNTFGEIMVFYIYDSQNKKRLR